jgi:CIC family chloride channel protein
LLAVALTMIWPGVDFDSNAYAVIGMSGLSAAVIGGPLTMTFIALETTGDLWLTTAVLIAVIISSQVTRELFGYSFATWRFHLRGETIRSAADVGWMRDLTVSKMMRHDVRTVAANATVAAFREASPRGSPAYIIAVDEQGRYVGMAAVADARRGISPEQSSKAFALLPTRAEPHVDQEAVLAFDRAEAVLAVVNSYSIGVSSVVDRGLALRRYSARLGGGGEMIGV